MNDYFRHKTYFVYRHVSPTGKTYVGITSQSSPEIRWGVNGCHYKKNAHFWNAIQKYGWDNFAHIVVAHGLSMESACHLEQYLICKYNSLLDGYNQTSGGTHPTEFTDEIRQTISEKVKFYRGSLPKGDWAARFVGHTVSDSTRHKISARLSGRHCSEESIQRRVSTFKANLTDDTRYKMGIPNRGKHLPKDVCDKISAKHTGKLIPADTRIKLSNSLKQTYASSKRVWVHNNDTECWIDDTHLSQYISDGYILGRLNNKAIYVSKDKSTIKINERELPKYLQDGWCVGFDDSRCANIKKSKQKFVYEYLDCRFASGKELAQYLQLHGYPKISQGTVNLICQGKSIGAYPELTSLIHRKEHTILI